MTLGPTEDAEVVVAVASLPMYDLPEVRPATDQFWGALAPALRARGVAAPLTLGRSGPMEAAWENPGLILSQTCGYPLKTSLGDRLTVVATPVYSAPGCAGPNHRSAIVVRKDSEAETLADLKGARCAVNERTSNTGMNLLRASIAPLAEGKAYFSQVVVTGSHAASLRHVGSGEADVAAIDCVTLALLERHRPEITGQVRVLAWSAPSPGLPFVTSKRQPPRVVAAIREALADVVRDPALAAARDHLLLVDVVDASASGYAPVLRYAEAARAAGYPELL